MQILYLLLSFIKLRTEYDEKDLEWPGGLLLIDEIDATLPSSSPGSPYKSYLQYLQKICISSNFYYSFFTNT